MSTQQIPIANIYYLYCYAWRNLEERDIVKIDEVNELEAVHDLLGLLLAEGVFRLVRTGLDRGYLDIQEDLAGVRGKVNASETMKRALRPKGRVSCEFQELSHNVLHNRILRTTLYKLLRLPKLDNDIRSKVHQAYVKLAGINILSLNRRVFNLVQLDRNRQYYRLLLSVCRLIYEQLLIDENTGEHTFKELQDERLERLFEHFVVEFYRREQQHYRVNQTKEIKWDVAGSNEWDLQKLPNMYADVILESKDRRIILDTKFYREAMSEWHEKKRLRSAHLYQLTAYLRNREVSTSDGPRHEGMLLYPTVSEPISVDLYLEGFSVKARSIDLAQDWRSIHSSMLALIDSHSTACYSQLNNSPSVQS